MALVPGQSRVGQRVAPLAKRDNPITNKLSLAAMPLLNPETRQPMQRRPADDRALHEVRRQPDLPPAVGHDDDHHPVLARPEEHVAEKRELRQPILPGMRRGKQRPIFSISDDRVMLQQVLETHSPDMLALDADSLLAVVRDIFSSPVPNVDGPEPTLMTALTSKEYGERSQFEGLTDLIDSISCEIECHCTRHAMDPALGLSDGRSSTTHSVLRLVSNYRWDAKLVLVLAALAVKYGVFLLIAQTHATNELTKSVAFIKQLPGILYHPVELKPRLDKIRTLMDEMVNLTKTIIEIYKIPDEYISQRFTDHIPVPVYWTVKYVLVCASQVTGSFEHDHLSSFTEVSDINMGTERLRKMNEHLRKLLHDCLEEIERNREEEEYYQLIRIMEELIHVDVTVPLSRFFRPIDYLYHGREATENKVGIDVLRRKNVLLLISNVDDFNEALYMLESMYNEVRHEGYFELVWIPVLDLSATWAEREMTKFEQLYIAMRWHIYPEPWHLNRPAIRYVKERWNFKTKPILVAMDPHGKVVCKNAFPMVWIWQQSMAFAFTTTERDLWKDQAWSIDFLIDGTDPTAYNWISEDRYVCVYGGEDMEWIRKFTAAVKEMARVTGIPVEMIYVGKRYPKERVQRIIEMIQSEKLSHTLPDTIQAWYFWDRIETMWESIHHVMKDHPEERNEKMLQEIVTILGYGGEHAGWALIGRASEGMVRAKGDVFYTCVTEVNDWRKNIPDMGFLEALRDHLVKRHPAHHCIRFLLPAAAGVVPEQIRCAECGRVMEKFLMYNCCVD